MQKENGLTEWGKSALNAGARIEFGRYPQGENGEIRPLEWRVLAVENGRALLITERLVDCVRYHEEYASVNWETCSLRRWLQEDFLAEAFSDEERERIAEVVNETPAQPRFLSEDCPPTRDKVFCLSEEQAQTFFRDDDDRMAAPTPFAAKKGLYVCDRLTAEQYGWKHRLPDGEETSVWWLRSPGGFSFSAMVVSCHGGISLRGYNVSDNDVAVRPALWLNLES